MDPKAMTEQATTFVTQLSAWAALALPNFVSAILLLAIGWWIAGRAERGIAQLLDKTSRIDPTLRSVISSLVRY